MIVSPDYLMISIFLCMIIMLIADLMMKRYLWTRKLIPRWKIISGILLPSTYYMTYIKSSRQEYGRVGIWLKIEIVSFALMMTIGILLAIFNPNK